MTNVYVYHRRTLRGKRQIGVYFLCEKSMTFNQHVLKKLVGFPEYRYRRMDETK
jgi:hypothetical protein